MPEKFQPIKIAKNSHLAKCLSSKIEVNINRKCFTIRADLITFFCLSIFRKLLSLKY